MANPMTPQEKEQIINNLISGVEGASPWTEEDRIALNAIPEEKLIALEEQRQLALNAKKPMAKSEPEPEEDEEEMDEEEDVTENQQTVLNSRPAPAPRTTQEWLAQAPPEIRSAVNNALNFERQRKEECIREITANSRNIFSDDYLRSRSIDELRGMVALLGTEAKDSVLNFEGVPCSKKVQTPAVNESFYSEDLDMALMD